MKLTPREKLLQAIRKNPNATFEELKRACKMSNKSVVDYHIKKLIAAGIIRKGNRWEIVTDPPASS